MDLIDANNLVAGTPTFFPAFLSHLRSSAPTLPIDPVVVQSILLCLVAGDKHLLLRAPEQDVRLVVRLAFFTLSTVFGLPTHKVKIRPRSPATQIDAGTPFLRSLFIPWTTASDLQDDAKSSIRTRNHATWARSTTKKPSRRSMSSPADAVTISSNPFSDNHEAFSGSSTTTNPFATTPRSARTRLPLPHTISDPTPVRDSRSSGMQPSALVVSGLENSALSSQRALTRVLAEKRVVLEEEDDVYDEVWNLPEGFITVYVCPVDPHERPAIHKNLLDKFAMSATVNPHAATRSLLTQTRNSASFRNSPAVHPVALPQQTPTAPTQSKSLQHHHSLSSLAFPLVSASFLTDLRALHSRTYLNPTLSLYASDLFSAARHHPQLDGMCLTAQSMKDAIDLARAGRVVGADLTGIELVRDDAAFLALQGSEPAQNQISDSPDIPESPEWPEQTDSKQHVYQPVEVVIEDADQQSIVPSALTGMPGRTGEQEVLEVSEADIARIVPRVMTHRLRVRNGPREELLASAVYPLVDDEHSVEVIEAGSRITVKDILVRILAEV